MKEFNYFDPIWEVLRKEEIRDTLTSIRLISMNKFDPHRKPWEEDIKVYAPIYSNKKEIVIIITT